MEYLSGYYQNAKALALVETVENGVTSYHLINYDKIISKHSVMKLDIPVVATFADGLVRRGVIKSISAKLTRLLSIKLDLESELQVKMFKPEKLDEVMNNNVNTIERLRLLDAKRRVTIQNGKMTNKTDYRNNPYNPLGLNSSQLLKINLQIQSFNLNKKHET